jgi:hypothetical protein
MVWERQRNQFKKWMKGEKQSNTLSRAVGYSREQLRMHIEAQFSEGMSWANYGEWHIDHIVPKNLDASRVLLGLSERLGAWRVAVRSSAGSQATHEYGH